MSMILVLARLISEKLGCSPVIYNTDIIRRFFSVGTSSTTQELLPRVTGFYGDRF